MGENELHLHADEGGTTIHLCKRERKEKKKEPGNAWGNQTKIIKGGKRGPSQIESPKRRATFGELKRRRRRKEAGIDRLTEGGSGGGHAWGKDYLVSQRKTSGAGLDEGLIFRGEIDGKKKKKE